MFPEGFTPAGPPWQGAGAEVHPLRDRAGEAHLALVFPPPLADHPALAAALEPVARFLEDPGIDGVAPLVHRGPGTFVYPANDGTLLARVLDRCAAEGGVAGVHAALELLQALGPVLDDVARAGRKLGVPAHGALAASRILIHPMGGGSVIGLGIPAVEVTDWLDRGGDRSGGPGPSLHHLAPERLDRTDADLRADLYALASIAAELALGAPLLTVTTADELATKLRAGAAVEALRAAPLPGPFVELLAEVLSTDPTARPSSGRAIASRAGLVLRGLPGTSLYDLAAAAELDDAGPRVADTVAGLEERVLAPPVKAERPPLQLEAPALEVPRAAPPRTSVAPAAAPPRTSTPSVPPTPSAPAAAPPRTSSPSVPPAAADAPPLTSAPSVPPTASTPIAAPPRTSAPSVPPGPLTDDLLPKPLPSTTPPGILGDLGDEESDRTDLIVPAVAIPEPPPRPVEPAPPPIPPLPDLPPEASLAAIQEHARKIVARTRAVADQAALVGRRIAERAGSDPSRAGLVRTARQAAERAVRSADSAASAAGLIELDEDASGALITLDLVRNAELQCEGALTDVSDQLRELERVLERIAAQARALADAARRAGDHANRATNSANAADDFVSQLEADQRAGRLTGPGAAERVDEAVSAAERAHAAAEAARLQAEAARSATRADDALTCADEARRAEDAALAALQETRAAGERARRADVEARQQAIAHASERLAAAQLASEQAERALSRATDATRDNTIGDPSAVDLASRCAASATRAAEAVAEAERALARTRTADHATLAQECASAATLAADRAEEAARDCTALSDRIVELAGAAAEARARMAKLREEAVALRERAKAAIVRTREELDRLQTDTSRLDGAEALERRADALAAFRGAEEEVLLLEEPAQQAGAIGTADALQRRVEQMRGLATRAHQAIDAARAAITAARSAAESELTELRRREEARTAVEQAATEARELARRCREQVDAAWRVARNLSPVLQRTGVEEAVRLRSKALEIIDIAEFQAGEAAGSADLAAREEEPAEARAHAQTAQSFLDRITADLPEALEALSLAETLATREVEELASARSRTAEAAATVEALRAEAEALRATLVQEASPWMTDEAVVAQLGLVEGAVRAFTEDQNEAGWARDRASLASTSTEASELLPNAEAATNRARDKRRRIDVLADSVRRAITGAEADANAVQEAKRATRSACDAVASELGRLTEAQQRLQDAIARHSARGELVMNSELQMRESVDEVRRILSELEVSAGHAALGTSADEGRRLSARAADLRRTVERLVEVATETEARGVAAAEQEARARAEARHQRLLASREEAAGHARRAHQTVERLEGALTEAREAAPEEEAARQRFDEAVHLAEAVRSLLAEVDATSALAAASDDATAAEALAERARQHADRIAADAARATAVVQEALDLARAAAAEAIALQSLRTEIASTAENAAEAVSRAQAEAARLPSIVRDASHVELKALSDEALQHVQAATKAAAKVKAAVPLAAQADSLPVAQSILKTARMALERANSSADAVRSLLDRIQDQIRAEKEAAARALAEARTRAAAPANDAVAAARKADGWLEAGRREAGEVLHDHSVHASVGILERAVAEARRQAEEAAALAARAESVETIPQADALALEVRKAAEQASEGAERARAVLGALRERITTLRAEAEAAAAVAAEAAEQAAGVNQVAEQAEATLRELEQIVGAAPDPAVASALQAVRAQVAEARRAAEAAHRAAEQARSARTTGEAEQAAEAAHAAMEDALVVLERVVEAEETCRTAIEDRRAAAAEATRREEEHRRQRAAEEARRQREQQQAAEEERRRRDEERKANVERRREERGLPVQKLPPAADREALREMLRKSRPTMDQGADPASVRPRRRADGDDRSVTEPNPLLDGGRPASPASGAVSPPPTPAAPSRPSVAAQPARTIDPDRPSASRPADPARPVVPPPKAVPRTPPRVAGPPPGLIGVADPDRSSASGLRDRDAGMAGPTTTGSRSVRSWSPTRSLDTDALMNTGTIDPRTGMPKTGPLPRTGPPPGVKRATRPTASRPPPPAQTPKSRVDEAAAAQAAPARPATGPELMRGSDGTKVDALLERLRARRAERD